MKLIIGLGNPGNEYKATKHNVGFRILDAFAEEEGINFAKKKYNAVYAEYLVNGEKIILLKPQEYINLSGQAVARYVKYFKMDLKDVFVIHDDLDVELGKYILKAKGNDGGHNGVRNIIDCLGTNEFKRLKIGIKTSYAKRNREYVLSSFSKEEEEELFKIIKVSKEIITDFVKMDFTLLMNKYN